MRPRFLLACLFVALASCDDDRGEVLTFDAGLEASADVPRERVDEAGAAVEGGAGERGGEAGAGEAGAVDGPDGGAGDTVSDAVDAPKD
jgi:hypothetical protein